MLIMHATRSVKFVRRSDLPAEVLGAIKYSTYNNYTIWEVPIEGIRLIDLSTCVLDENRLVENIVYLILKYKIVYFKHLPVDYHRIFENVVYAWESKIRDHARMPKHIEERKVLGSGGDCDSVSGIRVTGSSHDLQLHEEDSSRHQR